MIKNCDVLIVGTGISGLYTALNIDKDLKVILVTKDCIRDCNSYLAQGGISTSRNYEDIDIFIEDTLKAGNYKNTLSAVKILAKESNENINKLISYGVSFDKNNNCYHYTKEGGHQINRILHVKDQTGKAITETLIKKVYSKPNIEVIENCTLIDILRENICYGGIFTHNNSTLNIYSKFTVLATGGIGGLFNSSTNVESLTGDGLAIALKHDIEIKDINYLQLHPTVLYEKNKFGKRLLLSEALRGEGGQLLNIYGEKFVDPLLPRDKVSSAILKEIALTPKTPFVYLDLRHLGREFLVNRFPYIYEECTKRGYYLEEDLIKVAPAHHYCMGGIKVDKNSQTSLDNLYAVGEVSCTGVHGENRLASNSLLEAIVFSNRCAFAINILCKELNTSYVTFNKEPEFDISKNFIEFLKGQVDSRYDKLFNC